MNDINWQQILGWCIEDFPSKILLLCSWISFSLIYIPLRKLGEQIGVDIVGRCGDFSDGDLPPDHEYRYLSPFCICLCFCLCLCLCFCLCLCLYLYLCLCFCPPIMSTGISSLYLVSSQSFCWSGFMRFVAIIECCTQQGKTKWMLELVKLELSDSIWHLRTTTARITLQRST